MVGTGATLTLPPIADVKLVDWDNVDGNERDNDTDSRCTLASTSAALPNINDVEQL